MKRIEIIAISMALGCGFVASVGATGPFAISAAGRTANHVAMNPVVMNHVTMNPVTMKPSEVTSKETSSSFDKAMLASSDETSDSLWVTNLLTRAATLPASQNRILFFAKGFLGIPYGAGTLETYPVEKLVVRTDSVDCTTFVENVLALTLADKELKKQHSETTHAASQCTSSPYTIFKQKLKALRYRDGQLTGYTSRLHYFSEWITNNHSKGFVQEVTTQSPHSERIVDLNFMTEHASLYPFLANDPQMVTSMKAVEERFMGYTMHYIPKDQLDRGQDVLKINDGDIITLVTNLKGLDVVHVGFAHWIDGKLHLLHASSLEHKVILDPSTIFDYQKNRKNLLGIRAIRIL